MPTDVETKTAESLPSRLHRHFDVLQRIVEILREERTELVQSCLDFAGANPGNADQADTLQLRNENNELRQLVAELQEQLASGMERSNEAKLSLEEENAELRRSMHEKETFIEELRASSLKLSENPEARE